MPANKDFALRLEIIDECLRNRRRKWTLQDIIDFVNEKLAERYGKSASKRTIQNDLQHLEQEKQAPIVKTKNGTTTYFSYNDPNYSIKNLPVKEEEIGFLKDAIHILRQVNDFKILGDVDEIISKLQNQVDTNVEGSTSIIQFEKHGQVKGTEYIDDLFTAIKEKVALRIAYQPFKAEEPDHCIFHPYLLKEYRNRWFLIGRKAGAVTTTIFALDRIKAVKNSNESYLANDIFDPNTYFNNLIGVTIPEGGQIETVEIKIASSQVPYVKTKPLHSTQEIIKEFINGDVLLRICVINNYELRSLLLGFGCDIEVIKPVTLRTTLQEILAKAAAKYQS